MTELDAAGLPITVVNATAAETATLRAVRTWWLAETTSTEVVYFLSVPVPAFAFTSALFAVFPSVLCLCSYFFVFLTIEWIVHQVMRNTWFALNEALLAFLKK